MVFSKSQASLFESVVYRELERKAVKDGFFTPTEEQIVKAAAAKVSKTKVTGVLDVDIANLVSALRAKGLEKQASLLETNFVEYKKAENGLYNLKNEDIFDFAHPEGDVSVTDSEYGTVETIQSAAKKIRDLVEGPKGKKTASLKKKAQDPIAETEARVQAAFDNISAAKNSLDLNVSKINLENLGNKNVAQIYSELSEVPLAEIEQYVAARQLTNILFNNKPLSKNEAVNALSQAIKNEDANVFNLAKVLGIDVSKYGHLSENIAINFIKNTIDPLRISEVIGLIPNEVNKNIAKLSNDIYMGVYNSFINVLGENRNKFDESNHKVVESYNKVKSTLDAITLPPASEFVNYAQVQYTKIIEFLNKFSDAVLNVAKSDDGKLLDYVLKTIAPEEFTKLNEYVNNFVQTYHESVSSLPPEDSPMREIVPDLSGKLEPAVAYWAEKYKGYAEGTKDKENAGLNLSTITRLQKGLSQFINAPFINLKAFLPRLAQTLPKELPPQPFDQIDSVEKMNQYLNLILAESMEKKASVSGIVKSAGLLMPTSDTVKQQGAARPAETGGPAKSAPSVAGRPADDEKKAVVSMQRLLGKFSQGLAEKAEEIAPKVNMSVEQVRSLAFTIGFTGKSGETGEGSYDGKWGTNTSNALKAAKSIADKLDRNGEIVTGDVSYTKRDPKEVENSAKKNVEGLISIMKEVNLNPYLGEYNVELDYVPKHKDAWTEANQDPLNFNNPTEGFVVMPEHVKSIRDFFAFVSSVNRAKAASVNYFKIAQQIQDSTIIRQNPYGESKAPAGSMAYNDFITSLDWFYNRSNLVYRTALSRQRAGEPNPLTSKPYTNKEISIARAYHEQMQRLAAEWKNNYDKFFKEQGYISHNDFIKAERGIEEKPKQQGAGRPEANKERSQRAPGGSSIGVGGDSSESPLENPPLSDFINIFHLMDRYDVSSDDVQWFDQNVKTGVIDRKELRRSYIDEIVDKYSKVQKTKIENYKFMEEFKEKTSSVINDVFADWEGAIEEYLDDRRVQRRYRQQNRERDRWLEILSAKLEEARRLMGA